ncbi:hypothetical protein OROMI_001325 [Orobanche minor]
MLRVQRWFVVLVFQVLCFEGANHRIGLEDDVKQRY